MSDHTAENEPTVEVLDGGRVVAAGAAEENRGHNAENGNADDRDAKKVAQQNGAADGGREVEIGKEWDDGGENKDAAEREIEDPVVPGAGGEAAQPGTAGLGVGGGNATEGAEPKPGTLKRSREDEFVEPRTDHSGAQDHGQFQPKRQRQDCFRCGGEGHIAVMCISEHDAKLNTTLGVCRTCNGRGHMSRDCPNNIPPGVCFRCRREGHRGRDCPTVNMYGAHAPGQAAGGANAAQMGAYGGMPGGYYDPGYGRGYDAYGYDRHMYADPGMQAPRPRFAVGSGRCFRCDEPGHWTRDCPYRPPNSDPNGCYKCGRAGHRAKDCDVCFKCRSFGHTPIECPTHPQVAR